MRSLKFFFMKLHLNSLLLKIYERNGKIFENFEILKFLFTIFIIFYLCLSNILFKILKRFNRLRNMTLVAEKMFAFQIFI